ncbi:protein of unknown function [Caballeronia sp. S22]
MLVRAHRTQKPHASTWGFLFSAFIFYSTFFRSDSIISASNGK